MREPRIVLRSDVCADFEAATRREWLETNGLGGFASCTVADVNTRRYHGLLTAAMQPPGGRFVLLSKLEAVVTLGGRQYELSANRYPGVVHPQGWLRLTEFRLDPFPTHVWNLDGAEIRRTVFMPHGQNTTVIEYELTGADAAELEVRPLIAFRDYHSLTRRNDALRPALQRTGGVVSISPYPDLPALYVGHSAADVDDAGSWYFNFEYEAERERGLDYTEDLFNPFAARFSLTSRRPAVIVASTQPVPASESALLKTAELTRRGAIVAAAPVDNPLVRNLVSAADQYVVRRGDFETLIAGYHWFTDWGRDTMIALPGITLATGRFETARNILQAFAESVDEGMLPNRFTDAGETAEYNTVDATLWFFEAVRAYLEYSGDERFVLDYLYPRLREIIQWHLRGTRFGIRVDSDGLLACGAPGSQLTWMDAKIGDWVVTPRHGKPVEIEALWYNALCVQRDLAERIGDAPRELFLREMAALARTSFNAKFWNQELGCLYDLVSGDERDASVRPNQIFAISLHHPILDASRAASVLAVVERELLTPAGLRTLRAGDPAYRPRYEGGVVSRDSAYHQGTVWPWLLGPFITAYVRTSGRSVAARQQAREWLDGLSAYLGTACLGHIAEITDADPPHTPRGCVAQAWSIAEPLRAAVEDVFEARPKRAAIAAAAAE